jgi:hypothetical protein
MIYIRGSVQGFDTMAERTGNPIWSMKNVQKIYKELEDYKGHFDDSNDDYLLCSSLVACRCMENHIRE